MPRKIRPIKAPDPQPIPRKARSLAYKRYLERQKTYIKDTPWVPIPPPKHLQLTP